MELLRWRVIPEAPLVFRLGKNFAPHFGRRVKRIGTGSILTLGDAGAFCVLGRMGMPAHVAKKARSMSKKAQAVVEELKSHASPENVAGMTRYGINPRGTRGVRIALLRKMAREIGKDHRLAEKLWESGIHEAHILAALIDDPHRVTEAQMERWVLAFDSWDVCDQVCSNLFDKTQMAFCKAAEWAKREEQFVRRAGFVMMAALAVHDKDAADAEFLRFLPLIKEAATDERNFVKKAVNWALRQIGKKNKALHHAACKAAEEIKAIDSQSARWIAGDALRELSHRKF